MNQNQEEHTFEEDGTRPITSGDIEIAETFKEDGIRPIAKSPDYLVRNQIDPENAPENTQNPQE